RQPPRRARPRLARLDPRLEAVPDAEGGAGAVVRRLGTDEAEIDGLDQVRRGVHGVEGEAAAARIEGEVVGERPAAGIGPDALAFAPEEVLLPPEPGQVRRHVAGLDG